MVSRVGGVGGVRVSWLASSGTTPATFHILVGFSLYVNRRRISVLLDSFVCGSAVGNWSRARSI